MPPEPHVSLVVRAGTAIGAGAAASLAASVPAALRMVGAPEARLGFSGTWIALAAATLVPCVLAVLLCRAARRGLASFGGEGAATRALAFFVWLFASVDALIVFGALLRATTHHHALAGATFAAFGLLVVVALATLARRALTVAMTWSEATAHGILGLAAFGLGVLPLLIAVKAGPSASGLVVDALAYAIAAGFFSRPPLAGDRLLGIVGPPLSVVVLAIGLSSLRHAPLDAVVRVKAPLIQVPVEGAGKLVRGR
jgi:hypothetical protein